MKTSTPAATAKSAKAPPASQANPSISSLLNPSLALPARGLVEIIDVHGGSYFHIYVDGHLADSIYKDGFEATVLSRRFIKSAVKLSGVKEEQLCFVRVDWYIHGFNAMKGAYDANNFNAYPSYAAAHLAAGSPPAKTYHCRLLAIGIGALEEALLS